MITNFDASYTLVKPLKVHPTNKFGMVYLAQENEGGKYVVLKILEKKTASQLAIDRLRSEASFGFQFNGLPSIVEFIETTTLLALVKRYEEGIPLDAFWKKVKPSNQLAELVRITAALLPLFDYLAKQKIVHCDIKPSNILLVDCGGNLSAALIDFGLALRMDDPVAVKLLFPLGYAAPELVLNQRNLVNHQSDLFSVGIMCWRLMVGKLPLTHPNPSIYTNLQLTHPLPDDANLPKGLHPLLAKLSAKYAFRTAPNLLSREDVQACLRQGQQLRYHSLNEFYADLTALKPSRRWWNLRG